MPVMRTLWLPAGPVSGRFPGRRVKIAGRRVRTRRVLSLLAVCVTLASLVIEMAASAAGPFDRYQPFSRSGLSGSGGVVMQSITLPARIARVAVVPGSGGGEVWALGASSAGLEGWSRAPQGQVVFLRYTPATGWVLVGPPVDRSGRPINPTLSDMAFSATGEGWAVGSGGTLLRRAPGSSRWELDPASGQVTTELLQSVSLRVAGGRTVGYSVGKQSAILRYDGAGWILEEPSTEMLADGRPGFIGVAAVSEDEAWVVSDESSNALRIYRRLDGSWRKVTTGETIFDGPFPALGPNGAVNRAARGSSIAAAGTTVWVGGAMVPSDLVSEIDRPEAADSSRPFVLRIHSGRITSYCPDQYRLRQEQGGGVAPDTTALCDRPFPTAAFDIPSISPVSDDEAFAGGLGLFHFKGDGWFREPDSNGYLISVSMASSTEGWVATTGNTYFRGNAIRPESPLVGHWTARPESPSVARWPQTQRRILESVAISPDGSAAAAVGQYGTRILYSGRLGWDDRPPALLENLHAVAWPGDRPWAVGQRGVILSYPGKIWAEHPDSRTATRRSLFGLAFRSATDGVAVGSGGVILRFDGARWRPDPQSSKVTDQALYAITSTRDGYVAVGQYGTVIEQRGGSWFKRAEVASILERPNLRDLPHLYAATTLPSGNVVIGGGRSALLAAAPGEAFRPMEPPLEGTVLALASGRAPDGRERLLASVSQDTRKFDGDGIGVMRGTLLALDSGAWKDISFNRRVTISTVSDSSSFDDPVLGITTRDGLTGWAAGGTPAGILSSEFHLRSQEMGSVYRLELKGDPTPPFTGARLRFPDGVAFAVFGESWCGRGLCGAAAGTGTMADLVALQIRDEINRAAKFPYGPRFVLFTGNMRSTGIPEELAEFHQYLRGFKIPVFAAVGNRDLFAGLAPSVVGGAGGSSLVSTGNSGSNDYWKESFADMPRPWGEGPAPDGIRPVVGLSQQAIPDLARTHYAFDVLEAGQPVLRVIVIDSSTRSYGDPKEQNPPEPQATWFENVAKEGRLKGIPMVVAMNQPTVIPDTVQFSNWTGQGSVDQSAFEGAAAAYGVTAVFAGGLRMNTTDSLPYPRGGIVPIYFVGGGGAPLGFESDVTPPTKLPTDGFYHGWHLVTIDPDPDERNLLGQAPHSLMTFPTLDSLAMHSFDGESVAAGNVMRFSALGRGLPGGWSDLEQAKATHIYMGHNSLIRCPHFGQGDVACQSRNAIQPGYRFYSEDPTIAAFVLPDFGRAGRAPRLDPFTGAMLLDREGRFGLLCTFKAGTVGINVESGFLRKRMLITVGPGDGPCVDRPVIAPPEPPPVPEIPEVVPQPVRLFPKPPPLIEPLAVILPPAPGPIAVPAPPPSIAGARKEEKEYQHESEAPREERGEETAKFQVLVSPERRGAFDPVLGLLAGSAALMVIAWAAGVVSLTSQRPEQNYVRVRSE